MADLFGEARGQLVLNLCQAPSGFCLGDTRLDFFLDLLLFRRVAHNLEKFVPSQEGCIGLFELLDASHQVLIVLQGLLLGSKQILLLLLQTLDPIFVLVVQSLHFRELAHQLVDFLAPSRKVFRQFGNFVPWCRRLLSTPPLCLRSITGHRT